VPLRWAMLTGRFEAAIPSGDGPGGHGDRRGEP
jgi:hypothetical protein